MLWFLIALAFGVVAGLAGGNVVRFAARGHAGVAAVGA